MAGKGEWKIGIERAACRATAVVKAVVIEATGFICCIGIPVKMKILLHIGFFLNFNFYSNL
jgi:hypothetical protein